MTRSSGITLLAVVALPAGSCTGQAPPSASSPPAAASASSSTPSRTAVPSAAPSATQTAPPSPLPVASSTLVASPTVVSGELVLRVASYPDVYAAPVPPDLSVYSDGTVLTPGWRSPGFEAARFVVHTLAAGTAASRHGGYRICVRAPLLISSASSWSARWAWRPDYSPSRSVLGSYRTGGYALWWRGCSAAASRPRRRGTQPSMSAASTS